MKEGVDSVQNIPSSSISIFLGVVNLEYVEHFIIYKQVCKEGVEFSQRLLGENDINRHIES